MKKINKNFLLTSVMTAAVVISSVGITSPLNVEAAEAISVKETAEVFTNIHDLYTYYAKDVKGIKVIEKSKAPKNKTIVLEIDLNKVTENKNIPSSNMLKDVIETFTNDKEYLEALKDYSSTNKVEIIQNVTQKNNQFVIESKMVVDDLETEPDFQYVESNKYANKSVSFKDINNHWAKEHILSLAKIGIVSGYENNTFGANDTLTRGQFAAMLARTIPNADLSAEPSNFKDISNHWAKNDIALLNQLGIVGGTTATTFEPNKKITRHQASAMIIRYVEAIDIDTSKVSTTMPFTDTQTLKWGREDIGKLYNMKIIDGKDEKKFDPVGNLTRGQMAKMLNGVLQLDVNAIEKK